MKKKILRITPVIILFCVYLCGYVYFSVHFLPKTIINGNRCGMKTVKEGNDLEKKRMRDYQIIMRLNNSECIKKRYLNNNNRITLQKGGPFKDGGEFFFGLKIQDIFHLNFNE